ncbi:unnamed protein product [Protopolystoma xenopodis]|uniref:Uncharacterized protein n=1 Tax=Protopolystoma xenopodis TaxID=117903 RepID=A0A3S5B8A9_9PLAT|nr:unnamed protein product [Protopolystoma xenopodis]
MNTLSGFVPPVAKALKERRLILAETGQASPCIDLRLLASNLVKLVTREQVDLIVLIGMGRAVQTNLYARFSVDCLKVAVLKNAWLANRLGGQLFNVIFSFEPAPESSEVNLTIASSSVVLNGQEMIEDGCDS